MERVAGPHRQTMAKWQRLYHEVIASVFGRSLYWPKIRHSGRKMGEFVYLGAADRRSSRGQRGQRGPRGR